MFPLPYADANRIRFKGSFFAETLSHKGSPSDVHLNVTNCPAKVKLEGALVLYVFPVGGKTTSLFQIFKEIRELHGDSRTTIIVSSSVDTEADIQYGKKQGIHGYIVKPFDHKTLAGEILAYHEKATGPDLSWKKAILTEGYRKKGAQGALF